MTVDNHCHPSRYNPFHDSGKLLCISLSHSFKFILDDDNLRTRFSRFYQIHYSLFQFRKLSHLSCHIQFQPLLPKIVFCFLFQCPASEHHLKPVRTYKADIFCHSPIIDRVIGRCHPINMLFELPAPCYLLSCDIGGKLLLFFFDLSVQQLQKQVFSGISKPKKSHTFSFENAQ